MTGPVGGTVSREAVYQDPSSEASEGVSHPLLALRNHGAILNRRHIEIDDFWAQQLLREPPDEDCGRRCRQQRRESPHEAE
jgi:hypothetical protein